MYVKLNDVFDIHNLDQSKLCRSFGLKNPPRIIIKDKK